LLSKFFDTYNRQEIRQKLGGLLPTFQEKKIITQKRNIAEWIQRLKHYAFNSYIMLHYKIERQFNLMDL